MTLTPERLAELRALANDGGNDFYEAFDPTTAIALLDEIDRLHAQVEENFNNSLHNAGTAIRRQEERDAARKELAAARKELEEARGLLAEAREYVTYVGSNWIESNKCQSLYDRIDALLSRAPEGSKP